MTIDVIIPAYRPGDEFREVLLRLSRQTRKPDRIVVVNTEEKYWNYNLEQEFPLLTVRHISKREFDHGGTRQKALMDSEADIVVFMTQDAVPCRRDLLEKLTAPLSFSLCIAASYARQRPKKDCSVVERYTRSFNYPAASHVYFMKDMEEHGIKTFFCSNVCAAYLRDACCEAGGFPARAIFNEDMIIANRLMQKGYGVSYAADAEVFHSHNYNAVQQFHRNFDLGVSQTEFSEVFEGVNCEGEGIRLVLKTVRFLIMHGYPALIPELLVVSAAKYAGFRLGKRFRSLPRALILACTMNKEYWRKA